MRDMEKATISTGQHFSRTVLFFNKKNLKIVFQVVLKSGVIFEERSGAEKII